MVTFRDMAVAAFCGIKFLRYFQAFRGSANTKKGSYAESTC